MKITSKSIIFEERKRDYKQPYYSKQYIHNILWALESKHCWPDSLPTLQTIAHSKKKPHLLNNEVVRDDRRVVRETGKLSKSLKRISSTLSRKMAPIKDAGSITTTRTQRQQRWHMSPNSVWCKWLTIWLIRGIARRTRRKWPQLDSSWSRQLQ